MWFRCMVRESESWAWLCVTNAGAYASRPKMKSACIAPPVTKIKAQGATDQRFEASSFAWLTCFLKTCFD